MEPTATVPGNEANVEAMASRLNLAKQIFALFGPERAVHLALNAMTFAVLIYAAFQVIRRGAGTGDLGLICGSGGLVGLTSSRLLSMYTDIMNRVFGKL